MLLIEVAVPLEEGMEAKRSDVVDECREAGWRTAILPSGGGIARLHGVVDHTPPEGRGGYWRKAEEGDKGPGRGGPRRELLAPAEEEGQKL